MLKARGQSTSIVEVVSSLQRRSHNEFGSHIATRLLSTTRDQLLDWIRNQRMAVLPPEGSIHDRVFSYAYLFLNRIHSFDMAIEVFAGDSYLAAQLTYGYCALMLELGRENMALLEAFFRSLYHPSATLEYLLSRVEVLRTTQEIQEQLTLLMGDFVTLVDSITSRLYKATLGSVAAGIPGLGNGFLDLTKSFRQRCDGITEKIWACELEDQSVGQDEVAFQLALIKSWLAPEDDVVAELAEMHPIYLTSHRADLTCLWVRPCTARFLQGSSDTILRITGKPGSGKTMVASVIAEYLQLPIAGKSYQSLLINLDNTIPSQTTATAVCRVILGQVLARQTGNVPLYQIIADVWERCRKTASQRDQEQLLWKALERALQGLQTTDPFVIILDGTDQVASGEAVFITALQSAIAEAQHIKLIILGSNEDVPSLRQPHFPITEDIILDDIGYVVRECLVPNQTFAGLSELDQETVIQCITIAYGESFLCAKLAANLVSHETSAESLLKTANTIKSERFDVTNLTLRLLRHSGSSEAAGQMLLWLVTAERPLSLKELAALSSVHGNSGPPSDSPSDHPFFILKPLRHFLLVQGDYVWFRHRLIRGALKDLYLGGEFCPDIKDAQADLCKRLLRYIKSLEVPTIEPTLAPINPGDAKHALSRNHLLHFALTYWVVHIKLTTAFRAGGEGSAARDFPEAFPDSCFYILMEDHLWRHKETSTQLAMRLTAHRIRHHIMATDNRIMLQSATLLGQSYRQIGDSSEASRYFYEASTMSHRLLTPDHALTMQVALAYLDALNNHKNNRGSNGNTVPKSDLAKEEQILLLLVECYRAQYGPSSQQLLSGLQQLADQYRRAGKKKEAEKVIESIGSFEHRKGGAPPSDGVRKTDGKSNTDLFLDAAEDEGPLVGPDVSLGLLDCLGKAQQLALNRDFVLAESTYVESWHRASKEYRMSPSDQTKVARMTIVLEYTRFLLSRGRNTEAASLLSGVWQEYQSHTDHLLGTGISIPNFVELAKTMRTANLPSLALTVFRRCIRSWEIFGRNEGTIYEEVKQNITSISEELILSAGAAGRVPEATLETLICEVSLSIGSVENAYFTATLRLVDTYISQHRWQDATRVATKVLRDLWPSLFEPSPQAVTPPPKQLDRCVALARHLSRCYRSRQRFSEEEDLGTRIYNAIRVAREVGDALRNKVTNDLLHSFERSGQMDKVIYLHQEVLADLESAYDDAHESVLRSLWSLAALTRPHPVATEYYERIVKAVNQGAETCHPRVFEPLVIVATELWNRRQYGDALPHYQLIFNTFLRRTDSNPSFADPTFVATFFTRYTHCLRFATPKSQQSDLLAIMQAHHDKCKVLFPATSTASVEASMALARLCQGSKQYLGTAIHLYEELLQLEGNKVHHQEITTALNVLYEEHGISLCLTEPDSMTPAQVDRVISNVQRQTTEFRSTLGWSHERSISKLRDLISLYTKRKQIDIALVELKRTAVQILSSETSPTHLIAAGSCVASCYSAMEQTRKGLELFEELYRQIVMKDTKFIDLVQFNLSSVGCKGIVFLAQLEYSLLQNSLCTFDEAMSAITAEYACFLALREAHNKELNSAFNMIGAAPVYASLLSRGHGFAANHLFGAVRTYMLTVSRKRIQLTREAGMDLVVQAILEYFPANRDHPFLSSVALASIIRTQYLTAERKYQAATDLALTAFEYLSSQDSYSQTPSIVKFGLKLGMCIYERHLSPQPSEEARGQMLDACAAIVRASLQAIQQLDIDLSRLGPRYFNSLVGPIGAHGDYQILVTTLTAIWNCRKLQSPWVKTTRLLLGERLVVARFLVGDYNPACRLAEDLLFNCRRRHGRTPPPTLRISILLSQVYTSLGRTYNSRHGGNMLAQRYYKKAVALHEDILRAFLDKVRADYYWDQYDLTPDEEVGEARLAQISDGEHVRKHVQLLKLALQRLGHWPNDISEYARLITDLAQLYPSDLQGVEGPETWNLENFGSGTAETDGDLLNTVGYDWELPRSSF